MEKENEQRPQNNEMDFWNRTNTIHQNTAKKGFSFSFYRRYCLCVLRAFVCVYVLAFDVAAVFPPPPCRAKRKAQRAPSPYAI
jgi:hypothetical protein